MRFALVDGTKTDWHREWKARFPRAWREVVHADDRTGERHFADVQDSSQSRSRVPAFTDNTRGASSPRGILQGDDLDCR